jgi:hypothetical protein
MKVFLLYTWLISVANCISQTVPFHIFAEKVEYNAHTDKTQFICSLKKQGMCLWILTT